jgi:hypothetical protein
MRADFGQAGEHCRRDGFENRVGRRGQHANQSALRHDFHIRGSFWQAAPERDAWLTLLTQTLCQHKLLCLYAIQVGLYAI